MRLEEQMVHLRTRRVLVEELGDEVVLYDLDDDRAHLLSPNVARVWHAADGTRTVRHLRSAVVAETPAQSEFIVWDALEQLAAASMIQGSLIMPGRPGGMTRRTILKRLALTAVAIPVITTIVSPTPAAALTCGQTCQLNGASPTPCLGEGNTGAGNCRCSKLSGSGTCLTCRPVGSVVAECRLCCTPTGCAGTAGNFICPP
jgi:hypothetical protein